MSRCVIIVWEKLGQETIYVLPLLASLVGLSGYVSALQLGKILDVDVVARYLRLHVRDFFTC